MGLFSKKPKFKKDYFLVLDIGTEFVKVLVLKIENNFNSGEEVKRGIILGYARERQTFSNMHAGAVSDIGGVVLTCQAAIKRATAMARVSPQKVIIGTAGEFVKGLTTGCFYERHRPQEEIDLMELKNLVQKVQWRACQRARQELAIETGRSEIEIKLINALITEIKIDGYRVVNPMGFRGREIFLNIFNVYAPLVHLGALETIASKLNLELISVVAEPYALTRTSVFSPDKGAIFIDIGGGTTDIALVGQAGVENTKSLALAGRAFTKRLCSVLKLGAMEAEEVKLKYAQKQISDCVHRKIRDIFRRDIQTWLSGVELILEEFRAPFGVPKEEASKSRVFPSLILLCGGGSLLPGIKHILSNETIKEAWIQKFPFSQIPQIRFIQPEHITNIIDQTNLLKGPEDVTPMALASLLLEIDSNSDEIIPITLKRTIRMMR